MRIADIESFVRRFRSEASKARQAQSRLKVLERMCRMAAAHIDSLFNFNFPKAGRASDPLIILYNIYLGHN